SHENLEWDFYAAEQLLSIKPKDPEVYTMVMNMYVSAKRWKDESQLRKAMKEENFTKLKDWSWISIKDKVYSFKPDDKSCDQCQDVHVLLDNLLENQEILDTSGKKTWRYQKTKKSKIKNQAFLESITAKSLLWCMVC
nr:putative pentatricopeptide repeat-containing protein At5g52630 [Tanacetum cinerariifolium]